MRQDFEVVTTINYCGYSTVDARIRGSLAVVIDNHYGEDMDGLRGVRRLTIEDIRVLDVCVILDAGTELEVGWDAVNNKAEVLKDIKGQIICHDFN